MRSTIIALAVGACFLGLARPAHAQAWPVEHRWSDQARPDDSTSGSFAYEYAAESVAIEGSMTATGEAFDCSKAAMTVVVRYAAKHHLEIQFTLSDPANNWKVTTVSSSDPRFHSYEDFRKLYMGYINAKQVALYNTVAIAAADVRGGDLSLMRWNQLGDQNPFYPNDVWHTYSWGEGGRLLFYGNEIGADNHPAPVLASSESDRIAEATGQGDMGPALYGHSPRRWKFLDGMIVPPRVALVSQDHADSPQQATVTASMLNFRSAPSAHGAIVGKFPKGTKLTVEGVAPYNWLRVRLPDGTVGYVSGDYATLAAGQTSFHVDADAEGLTQGRFDHNTPDPAPAPAPAPSTTTTPVQPPRTGISEAVPQNDGN